MHAVHFWTTVGIGGRHPADSVDGMRRNPDP
jgi:hypothetical protein